MSDWYILNEDGTVRLVSSFVEAGRWMADNRAACRIERTELDGNIEVSTVFLSLDHNWMRGQAPLLFETMVFGGTFDQWQWRYHAIAAARTGHERIVEALRTGVGMAGFEVDPGAPSIEDGCE